MLTNILIGLAVLLIVFVVFVLMRPSEFRITRTATIAAPPAAVFAQVNDFHNWMAWSPWEKLDPALKRTYAGASAGTGAIYSWAGNKQVGEGRMTLLERIVHDGAILLNGPAKLPEVARVEIEVKTVTAQVRPASNHKPTLSERLLKLDVPTSVP